MVNAKVNVKTVEEVEYALMVRSKVNVKTAEEVAYALMVDKEFHA